MTLCDREGGGGKICFKMCDIINEWPPIAVIACCKRFYKFTSIGVASCPESQGYTRWRHQSHGGEGMSTNSRYKCKTLVYTHVSGNTHIENSRNHINR